MWMWFSTNGQIPLCVYLYTVLVVQLKALIPTLKIYLSTLAIIFYLGLDIRAEVSVKAPANTNYDIFSSVSLSGTQHLPLLIP